MRARERERESGKLCVCLLVRDSSLGFSVFDVSAGSQPLGSN